MTESVVPAREIVILPVDSIVAGDNAREKYNVDELAASIEAVGLLHPIIVRRLYDGDKEFQVCAGHRRFKAVQKLGWQNVESMILEGCDDQKALSIMQTENLQREDLTPLEEAKTIDALVRAGVDVGEIARIQGKTRSWVALRRRMLSLSPKWKAAAENEASPVSRWPASHLAIVSMLEPEVQEDRFDRWERQHWTTDALNKAVGALTRLLKKVPWGVEDSALVEKAGACTTCPMRSSRIPGLFEDDEETEISADDQCLNDRCWNEKNIAYCNMTYASMVIDQPGAVMVVAKNHSWGESAVPDGALNQWDYEPAKKADPDSVPALVVGGSSPGRKVWVRLADYAKKKLVNKEVDPDTGEVSEVKRPKTLKERGEDLKRRRLKLAITKAAGLLSLAGSDVGDDDTPPPPVLPDRDRLFRLVVAFGTRSSRGVVGWVPEGDASPEDALLDLDVDELCKFLWPDVLEVITARWKYQGAQQDLAGVWEDVKLVCGFLEIDCEGFLKDAEVEIPEPKSWDNLNKDGTPKAKKN